jgi:hypothetical protein
MDTCRSCGLNNCEDNRSWCESCIDENTKTEEETKELIEQSITDEEEDRLWTDNRTYDWY